jgi:hypothetical protein
MKLILINDSLVVEKSWYGSWIYDYLCNQCPSPVTFRVRIPPRRGVVDTTLCDQVCQWLVTGRLFSPGTLVFSTNRTDRHDIAEILALNTIPPVWPKGKQDTKADIICELSPFQKKYFKLSHRTLRTLS